MELGGVRAAPVFPIPSRPAHSLPALGALLYSLLPVLHRLHLGPWPSPATRTCHVAEICPDDSNASLEWHQVLVQVPFKAAVNLHVFNCNRRCARIQLTVTRYCAAHQPPSRLPEPQQEHFN